MLNALSKLPVEKRKPIASGLLSAAFFMTMFGGLFFFSFLEAQKETCTGPFWSKECVKSDIPLETRLPNLVVAVALIIAALACVLAAFKLTTSQGRLKRYEAILTGVECLGITQIASITKSKPSVVRNDIQNMIDSEMITDFYINYQTDQVISKKYVPKTSYKTVEMCPNCGAYNEVIIGITRTCTFCARPLPLR